MDTRISFSLRKHLIAVALLMGLVLICFGSTIHYQFIYDDHKQIEQSQRYYTDFRWIPEYFTHPLTFNYYRPMFMVWFLLNNQLFGLDPRGWHATTVLAHLLACVLCYGCAFQLTRRFGLAFLSAGLFAVHPAHVESVAWISGVSDPLLAVFVFGSFWCYLLGRERFRLAFWTASVVLAAGAMCTKEVGIIIPVLIAAHAAIFDDGPLRKRIGAALIACWPTVVCGVVYWTARHHIMTAQVTPSVRWLQMVLLWPQAVLFYLRHLVWPVGLSIFYELDLDRPIPLSQVLWPSLAVLFAMGAVALLAWKTKSRIVIFAAVWTALTLAPTLYLLAFPVGEDLVHDRYLYLPVFGFTLILAYILQNLPSFGVNLLRMSGLAVLCSLILFSFYIVRTLSEEVYYADDLKLYYRAAQISPGNQMAWMDLGVELAYQKRYAEAYEAYQRAISLKPHARNLWLIHENLGYMLVQTGNLEEAERELDTSRTVNPRYSRTYVHYGMLRMRQARYDEALAHLKHAVELDSQNPEAHYLMAYIYSQRNDRENELKELHTVLAVDPSHAYAKSRLQQIEGVQKK